MRLLPLALAALVFTLHVRADDAAIAQQLEAAGGKITRKDGAITQLEFKDCAQVGDAEFRVIGQLAGLKNLTLHGGKQKLNDETVGHLLGLKELETFSSEGARLSDAALARLAALTNLRMASFYHLSYRHEGFTGEGFAAWKSLPKLERLTVAGMTMGDPGFAAIAQLSGLRDLATWHTHQTEAGNAHIARLPRLTTLKVGQRLPRPNTPPSFTDASLATFASIKTLETLRIMEARLSLTALRVLSTLPNLKLLHISECDISDADVDALRRELPKVKIDFKPLTPEERAKLEKYLR